MMETTKTAFVVALMCVICLSLLAFDDSDADESLRMSDNYLYKATVVLEPGEDIWTMGSYFVTKEGSPNDQLMDRYLQDPTDTSISLSEDDQWELVNGYITEPTTVNVYMSGGNYLYNDYFNGWGHVAKWNRVLERDNDDRVTFFIKAGDRFELDITIRNENGSVCEAYLYTNLGSEDIVNGHYSRVMESSTSVSVRTNTNGIYFDVWYDASGYSAPNGSPTVYAAVCILITVVILGVLVVAGLKPKWSK